MYRKFDLQPLPYALVILSTNAANFKSLRAATMSWIACSCDSPRVNRYEAIPAFIWSRCLLMPLWRHLLACFSAKAPTKVFDFSSQAFIGPYFVVSDEHNFF